MARALLLFTCALAGCDEVWDLEPLPDADTNPCEHDEFADPRIDGARWSITIPLGTPPVLLENEQLVIRPASFVEGYNGVHTIEPRDLTNASVSVEVAQSIFSGVGDTQFVLKTDILGETDFFMIYTNQEYIGFRNSAGFVPGEAGVMYTPADRFWQIRFENGDVVFETSDSGDAASFNVRRRLPAPIPVTRLFMQLRAGTYAGGSDAPGEARFDNVKICPPPTR